MIGQEVNDTTLRTISQAVYKSYIDITSPGEFPKGLTPQMFIEKPLSPVRRNPLITRTLYYSKDMESFATGLKRIQEACDHAGCKVEYNGNAYSFTVRFYRHSGKEWESVVSANGTHGGTHDGTHELSKQIILLISDNNKMTRKEMAEKLDVSLRTLQRIINSMDNIHYVGSGNHGHWEIKDNH